MCPGTFGVGDRPRSCRCSSTPEGWEEISQRSQSEHHAPMRPSGVGLPDYFAVDQISALFLRHLPEVLGRDARLRCHGRLHLRSKIAHALRIAESTLDLVLKQAPWFQTGVPIPPESRSAARSRRPRRAGGRESGVAPRARKRPRLVQPSQSEGARRAIGRARPARALRES